MIKELAERSESLAPHFKPDFLPRETAIFQFEFDEGEPFYLNVHDRTFSFSAGNPTDPTIKLHISDHETCWGLLEGHIDGMHAFMDGRDTAPQGGKGYLKTLEDHLEGKATQLATVIGRYYAMDRDNRWAPTKLA